jgi:uncharacterized membrane protein
LDIIDVNLPWVYYISTAAVALARLLKIADIQSLTGLIVLVTSISAVLMHRILRAANADDARFRYICLLSFFVAALLAPAQDFAQREQLIFILVAPYLLAVAARSKLAVVGTFDSIAAGVLAGVSLMIKPHWALLPMMLEVWLLIRTRRLRDLLRSEPVALAVTGAAGFAATLWITPLYSSGMVPLALETYWAYDNAFGLGVLIIIFGPIAFGWAAVVLMRAFRSEAFQPFVWTVLVVTLAGTSILALQGKFFEYHALPMKCATVWVGLAAALYAFAARLKHSKAAPHMLLGPPAVISLLLACAFIALRWTSYTELNREQLAILETAVRRDGPVPSLYALSTSIPPTFPLVNQLGASWPGRLQLLWPLPAIIRPSPLPPERKAAIAEWIVRTVVEDLSAAPPAVILIQTTPAKQALANHSFDYLPWFSRDAEFRRLWNRYEFAEEVTAVDERYQIWRLRKD